MLMPFPSYAGIPTRFFLFAHLRTPSPLPPLSLGRLTNAALRLLETAMSATWVLCRAKITVVDASPEGGRRKRPVLWAIVGVAFGAAAMAGVDRLVLREPHVRKVVDTYCMPVVLESTGEIAPLGILVRVYDDGYAYPGVLLNATQEAMRDLGSESAFLGGADYCVP